MATVNLLANIPLTEKQRKQIIFRFLEKTSPDVSLAERMTLQEQLYVAWTQHPKLALHDVVDLLDEKEEAERQERELEDEETFDSDREDADDTKHETFSLDVVLNAKQRLAVDFAKSGKSFVLTGPAGSGKTTAEREIVKALLSLPNIRQHKFKDKRTGTRHYAPSVAVVGFTNKAANNSAKAILKDPALAKQIPYNITTIHNLLEFEPEFFDRPDGTTGMRFKPTRDRYNPLDCTHIIVEEASNVGALDLYQFLYDAIRPGTTMIFVGDINQLPPIFSPSILNYALCQLPVVELTEIYRQALDSPIIANAHKVLKGEMVVASPPYFTYLNGKRFVDAKGRPKLVSESACVQLLTKSIKKWIDVDDPSAPGEKTYDPEQDIILSPYNIGESGTQEINKHIAQMLGVRRNAIVYEIIAGMQKHYLAVGDHVLFLKREGVITKINRNAKYVGKAAQMEGEDLSRWGMRMHTNGKDGAAHEDFETIVGYEDFSLDNVADAEDEKRKQAATHVVTIEFDDGETDSLDCAGDFGPANFSLGYALTVHKAQGSEWRKVFFMIHKRQAPHLNREIIYTAITRARTHCMVIDFTDQLPRAISSQRIKGDSVEEKIAFFNSEISLKVPIDVLKP
jgi:exodeoxyribonuclease V alpha subunit